MKFFVYCFVTGVLCGCNQRSNGVVAHKDTIAPPNHFTRYYLYVVQTNRIEVSKSVYNYYQIGDTYYND
jgi:hypothetical protein